MLRDAEVGIKGQGAQTQSECAPRADKLETPSDECDGLPTRGAASFLAYQTLTSLCFCCWGFLKGIAAGCGGRVASLPSTNLAYPRPCRVNAVYISANEEKATNR